MTREQEQRLLLIAEERGEQVVDVERYAEFLDLVNQMALGMCDPVDDGITLASE